MNRLTRSPDGRRGGPRARRGFNIVELLMALGISAMLLTATMVALDASFMAYQNTTEMASTHTISRLAMHRILTMIRNGVEFGPRPLSPLDPIVESTFIEVNLPDDDEPDGLMYIMVEWDEVEEALFIRIGAPDEPRYALLEGVIEQTFPAGHPRDGEQVPPFTLEFDRGILLYRATVDLLIQPDDNMKVDLDGDRSEQIHLVATSMPRGVAHE